MRGSRDSDLYIRVRDHAVERLFERFGDQLRNEYDANRKRTIKRVKFGYQRGKELCRYSYRTATKEVMATIRTCVYRGVLVFLVSVIEKRNIIIKTVVTWEIVQNMITKLGDGEIIYSRSAQPTVAA